MPWKESSPMSERLAFVRACLDRRQRIVDICHQFGISEKTGHKILQRFRADGEAGLLDRSHAPRHCPHRIAPAAAARIIALRKRHPLYGAEKLRDWYARHLGLAVESWGGSQFHWRQDADPQRRGYTVWSVFQGDSTDFDPSDKPFMINDRVEDLDAVLTALRSEGITVDPKIEESEYGRFGWVMDPEGNRIELWEPPRDRSGDSPR